ncbi:MAG: trypsin-like serine protease [Actinophytocola sp.]|uniref:trypsin-like serine protease n=1 Tax=Actinophytocola sp. TaxID=1872138 RepID=UPI003C717EE3
MSTAVRRADTRWPEAPAAPTDNERCSLQDICIDNPHCTDGVCSGDSGPPAIRYTRQGVPQFVGVVSRGGGLFCGTTPGVYTSAPTYRTWLYNVVCGAPANPAPSHAIR